MFAKVLKKFTSKEKCDIAGGIQTLWQKRISLSLFVRFRMKDGHYNTNNRVALRNDLGLAVSKTTVERERKYRTNQRYSEVSGSPEH